MLFKRAPRRRARRGQSEVIGGLIVLTLLFAFAVPMLINTYNTTVQMGTTVQQSLQQEKTSYNEKIEIRPLDPNNEAFIRAGWIPGVFINNTGTVTVTLEKLILLNKLNNSIFRVYDLRYARDNLPEIDVMLMDVDIVGGAVKQPPPPGNPITLKPGENLLVVFNESILPFAPQLVVLVESASGVIHPIVGGGAEQPLYPGRPGAGGGGGAGPGAWRGIFAPQSGFKLVGAYQLDKSGYAHAWTPPMRVYAEVRNWWWWELGAFSYYTSFIYNDPEYPGLYYLYIIPAETIRLNILGSYGGCGNYYYTVYSGWLVQVRGYVGTYDTGDGGTYFNGWAYEVRVYSSGGRLLARFSCSNTRDLGATGVTWTDFDGNGVNEVTVYSYLNGPNIATTSNIDADRDGDDYKDAVVWTYMVSRDISGVDFIKITAKVNYYWTTVFRSCPDWEFRHLKTFAVVVWQYNNATGTWEVYHFMDYTYTTDKPKQYQPVITFPVDRHRTYRVGLMFFDNYRDWDGYDKWCHTDFTFAIEHIIVEYGVLNPLFQESPPLYIIAIPDPDVISGIGERDYMNAYNISDVTTAMLQAQHTLLTYYQEELSYAGVAGYTVITDPNDACNLLFGGTPPKNAIILWLQGGNISFSDVLPCVSSESTVYNYAKNYHWILVWPMEYPFSGPIYLTYYNNKLYTVTGDNLTATITEQGVQIRIKAYAFYLFNKVPFKVQLKPRPGYEYLLIPNGTFYANETNTTGTWYGTSAYWLYQSWGDGPGTGAIVVNPVHLDWDLSGDGVPPQTVVQQTVYAALETWNYMVRNY